jgi:hypothetical protein
MVHCWLGLDSLNLLTNLMPAYIEHSYNKLFIVGLLIEIFFFQKIKPIFFIKQIG